jgi:hypothetical protein
MAGSERQRKSEEGWKGKRKDFTVHGNVKSKEPDALLAVYIIYFLLCGVKVKTTRMK